MKNSFTQTDRDYSLDYLKEWALEDMEYAMQDSSFEEDWIYEIADSRVPVYFHHTLAVAMNDCWLASEECPLGMTNPIAIINNKIYEELIAYLFEQYEIIKEANKVA